MRTVQPFETFEVQNMGNEAFQNASFGDASFPTEALGLPLGMEQS